MTSLSGETPTKSGEKFRQFEVVDDYSDHHYTKRRPKLTPLSTNKIMQEWKLLSKELPESIYVRAYETRVDLLRAVIVGAPETPYSDGLFFFDIAFPSDYPLKPPLVHYHSFGYQINPVMFKNGGICISLLTTHTGKKGEKWDPNRSTIFQVLLSIQALVLKDHREWALLTLQQWKPIPYNEEVFVLNCKTMLRVLNAPPKHLEPLVKQHFNDRAESILKACNAFKEGWFDGHEVSAVFKAKMDRLYGGLLVALARNGASVGYFIEQLMEEAKREEVEKETGRIDLREAGKNVVKKLKKNVVLDSMMNNVVQLLPEFGHYVFYIGSEEAKY